MEWWVAVILGVVEGLTEFLPVSSTGHLIVTGHVLGFTGDRAASIEISIQLGAVLAVLVYYRRRLITTIGTFPRAPQSRQLVFALACAFTPAAVIGLLTHHYIKAFLFHPLTVGAALIAGGIAILVIEHTKGRFRIHDLSDIGIRDAVLIGIAQCFALFPGVSRSGATIMGGLLVGLDRKTATEFSFLLALPTMLAATGYELLKSRAILTHEDWAPLGIGLGVSFFTALLVISAFLRYVTSHTFTPFGVYRCAFGLIVLYLFW